jgi:hypothetical protein
MSPKIKYVEKWMYIARLRQLMRFKNKPKTYSPFCGQPEKNAILSFYALGLRVDPRPSRQTTLQNCPEEKRRGEED